ncbi:MAG: Nif3-like dinuclear metal center hexameric protein [Acutalibacteraceae bacterium]
MEKRLFDLDNRLAMCASFVRKNSRIADIGTDHAYLPVWLCKNNIAVSAIAGDINPKPLESCVSTIAKYNATELVTPCLSNGLKEVAPDSVDDIIIAGMGGELIVSILDNAKWVQNEKYHLILQPMTKSDVLREYLYSNGFNILQEECTTADNKLYSVMSVVYTGNVNSNCQLKKYYGCINPLSSENNKEYVNKVALSLQRKGNGMLSANSFSKEGKTYIMYSKKLLEYGETGVEPKMTQVNDIYTYINSFAPFDTAFDYDNVGVLVGDKNAIVDNVLVALDITPEVILEAQKLGANMIISHHPVIFKPIKSLSDKSVPYMLAQRGITALSAHTNLDLSPKGVNICLAKALGLTNIYLHSQGIAVGDLPVENPISPKQLALLVKDNLNCNGVRYTDSDNEILRVAVGGGACGEYIYLAKELGANAFLTGEIKHNYILEAYDINLTVVDAGHYKTEDIVIDYLVEQLSKEFPNVSFTKSCAFTDHINFV